MFLVCIISHISIFNDVGLYLKLKIFVKTAVVYSSTLQSFENDLLDINAPTHQLCSVTTTLLAQRHNSWRLTETCHLDHCINPAEAESVGVLKCSQQKNNGIRTWV